MKNRNFQICLQIPLDNDAMDDCAKDGIVEVLPEYNAFELGLLNESMGIRLWNAMQLGKKFLAAVFSTIMYWDVSPLMQTLFQAFLERLIRSF